MKNNIKGFLILSSYVDKCLYGLYKSKGLALKKIIYDWHKIVGDNLSKYTLPYKVTIDKRDGKQKRLLHVFVANSSFSSELFHMSNIILEKIRVYVGTDYIDQLRLNVNPSLSADIGFEEEQVVRDLPEISIEGIEDTDLEKSLKKLGQAIKLISSVGVVKSKAV